MSVRPYNPVHCVFCTCSAFDFMFLLLTCVRINDDDDDDGDIFMEARYCEKLGRVRKWLHFDALRRAFGDLTTVTF